MQGLGAEDHVHVRGLLDDPLSFLTRDAASDGDPEVRVFLLQVPDPAEFRIDLLLRLVAHGAGVEDDEVGVLGSV